MAQHNAKTSLFFTEKFIEASDGFRAFVCINAPLNPLFWDFLQEKLLHWTDLLYLGISSLAITSLLQK
jgi:hypothetical protein